MNEASVEAKNTILFAMSSWLAFLPKGVFALASFNASSHSVEPVLGESTGPGLHYRNKVNN